MAIVTTYTCDKCGHSQKTDEQMWHIGVAVSHRQSLRDTTPAVTALWCRACVVNIGLFPTAAPAGEPRYKPQPTLEEMIREIVYKALPTGGNP